MNKYRHRVRLFLPKQTNLGQLHLQEKVLERAQFQILQSEEPHLVKAHFVRMG